MAEVRYTKLVLRKIVDYVPDPKSKHNWICHLECGHVQYIAGQSGPKKDSFRCVPCNKGNKAMHQRLKTNSHLVKSGNTSGYQRLGLPVASGA